MPREKVSSVTHRSSEIVTITECLPLLFFSLFCLWLFSVSIRYICFCLLARSSAYHSHTYIYVVYSWSVLPHDQFFWCTANTHNQFLNTYTNRNLWYDDIHPFFLSSLNFHLILHLCSCLTLLSRHFHFLFHPSELSKIYHVVLFMGIFQFYSFSFLMNLCANYINSALIKKILVGANLDLSTDCFSIDMQTPLNDWIFIWQGYWWEKTENHLFFPEEYFYRSQTNK